MAIKNIQLNNFLHRKSSHMNRIIVILDNIRSAQNVGSFFRTSDVFNVDKIMLCGITSIPPNKEIFKTALGATEMVKWKYYDSTEACINELKDNNFKIYCVEQVENSTKLNNVNFDFSKTNCFVFGNEVDGVSEDIIKMADVCIEIPQFGTKHSLNVAVAGGIILWDFVNKKMS